MKKVAAIVGLICLVSFPVLAEDKVYPGPQEGAPNIYTQILDNERVRVSELKFNPGDKAPMHTHAFDHVLYVVEGGTLTLSYTDGTSKEMTGVPGQAIWMPKETHEAVNTGTTVVRVTVTELK